MLGCAATRGASNVRVQAATVIEARARVLALRSDRTSGAGARRARIAAAAARRADRERRATPRRGGDAAWRENEEGLDAPFAPPPRSLADARAAGRGHETAHARPPRRRARDHAVSAAAAERRAAGRRPRATRKAAAARRRSAEPVAAGDRARRELRRGRSTCAEAARVRARAKRLLVTPTASAARPATTRAVGADAALARPAVTGPREASPSLHGRRSRRVATPRALHGVHRARDPRGSRRVDRRARAASTRERAARQRDGAAARASGDVGPQPSGVAEHAGRGRDVGRARREAAATGARSSSSVESTLRSSRVAFEGDVRGLGARAAASRRRHRIAGDVFRPPRPAREARHADPDRFDADDGQDASPRRADLLADVSRAGRLSAAGGEADAREIRRVHALRAEAERRRRARRRTCGRVRGRRARDRRLRTAREPTTPTAHAQRRIADRVGARARSPRRRASRGSDASSARGWVACSRRPSGAQVRDRGANRRAATPRRPAASPRRVADRAPIDSASSPAGRSCGDDRAADTTAAQAPRRSA